MRRLRSNDKMTLVRSTTNVTYAAFSKSVSCTFKNENIQIKQKAIQAEPHNVRIWWSSDPGERGGEEIAISPQLAWIPPATRWMSLEEVAWTAWSASLLTGYSGKTALNKRYVLNVICSLWWVKSGNVNCIGKLSVYDLIRTRIFWSV